MRTGERLASDQLPTATVDQRIPIGGCRPVPHASAAAGCDSRTGDRPDEAAASSAPPAPRPIGQCPHRTRYQLLETQQVSSRNRCRLSEGWCVVSRGQLACESPSVMASRKFPAWRQAPEGISHAIRLVTSGRWCWCGGSCLQCRMP